MAAFLGLVRERHGSIGGYLADAGLEGDAVDALRARLLS